ncbi:hypothetical protein [Spirosoma utsteinense]|uniref:Uncharacterized protein n=1 Tax=Spirosoma utsteinense TaxID=2585773 RepID=A0ABR6W1D6_9BACT|nr:hypothetical protein [Spirosoma utsteinense]MBC3790417.1 hypothetical protein [Spirosoma utsteinense]
MLFLRNTPYANYTINLIFVVAHLLTCVYIIQRPSLLYGANWFRKPARDPDGISEQAALAMPPTDPIGRISLDAVRQDGASLANGYRKVSVTTPSEPDAREKTPYAGTVHDQPKALSATMPVAGRCVGSHQYSALPAENRVVLPAVPLL